MLRELAIFLADLLFGLGAAIILASIVLNILAGETWILNLIA